METQKKKRDLSKSPKLGSNWIDIWTQVYPPYHIGMITWVSEVYNLCL